MDRQRDGIICLVQNCTKQKATPDSSLRKNFRRLPKSRLTRSRKHVSLGQHEYVRRSRCKILHIANVARGRFELSFNGKRLWVKSESAFRFGSFRSPARSGKRESAFPFGRFESSVWMANTQVLAYLVASDCRLGWAKGKVLSLLVPSGRRFGWTNSQVVANLVHSDRRLAAIHCTRSNFLQRVQLASPQVIVPLMHLVQDFSAKSHFFIIIVCI